MRLRWAQKRNPHHTRTTAVAPSPGRFPFFPRCLMDVAGSLPKKIFPRLCPWENGNIYIWYATAEPYSELQVRRSMQPSQLSSARAALYFHSRTGLFRFPARRLAEKTATGSVTPPFSRSQHHHIINTNSVATSGCELLAFTAPRKNTDRFRDG